MTKNNWREELYNWNFDRGNFKIFGYTVSFKDDNYTVENEYEAFDFDRAEFDEVIALLEVFED